MSTAHHRRIRNAPDHGEDLETRLAAVENRQAHHDQLLEMAGQSADRMGAQLRGLADHVGALSRQVDMLGNAAAVERDRLERFITPVQSSLASLSLSLIQLHEQLRERVSPPNGGRAEDTVADVIKPPDQATVAAVLGAAVVAEPVATTYADGTVQPT